MRRLHIIVLALVPTAVLASQSGFDEPWWTSDQQAARLFHSGNYAEAAERFDDPAWHAMALYRNGDFKRAAAALSGQSGAEAAYNRGNALVFLGLYEEAVTSYERALEIREGWEEASVNLRIARSRIRGEAAFGEATELGADDIVFTDQKIEAGDPVEVTGGRELSDEAMRALWLRNVQTRPEQFLRAKFAYQRATEQSGQETPK